MHGNILHQIICYLTVELSDAITSPVQLAKNISYLTVELSDAITSLDQLAKNSELVPEKVLAYFHF